MNNLPSTFINPPGRAEFVAAYDNTLALWPIPVEPLDVQTKYGITHINACGSKIAPPLFLLHALGFTSTMWFPNVACLSDRFRVYAVDTINDIGLSQPNKALRNRQECADWLCALFTELKIEQACMAGVSFGGWLTVNLAIHSPDRVKRMVAISPAAAFVPIRLQAYLSMLTAALFPNGSRSMVNSIFLNGFQVNEQLANQFTVGTNCGWQSLGRPVFPSVFSDTELRQIKTPTLLLFGEKETNFDPNTALKRATHLLPCVEAHIIPQARHIINIEQPEMINSLTMEFLSRP